MDKNTARKLLPIVNDHVLMGILAEYAEARIAYFHKQMEHEADVKASQGAIKELRRIATLRDEVVGVLNAN